MKYVCDVCGYEYDEALGDPDHGIAPGTKWEDLPAGFCRAGGEDFCAGGGQRPCISPGNHL